MLQKIKVLHLRDTYEIGGPGKTILETYNFINKDRFDFHVGVFTRGPEKNSPFISAARSMGIPLHLIEGSHAYDPRTAWNLIRILKAHKFDILHTHEAKSDLTGFLASKFFPVALVTTIHGRIENNLKQKLMAALGKAIVRKFNKVIVVSKKMQCSMLKNDKSDGKLVLLHNCIVMGRYANGQNSRWYLSKSVARELNRPLIGCIGRLSKEKGQQDLIKAASIVVSRGFEPSFVIVGDGPDREIIESLIAKMGLGPHVHLTGYLHDMQNVYNDLDLMVLPSHTEGLPNVVLESLAMEVPVIATAVGGTPEIIDDRQSGVLVEPGQPESLAEKIIEFITNREVFALMASKGKAKVKADFDFACRTRKLEGIYEEIYAARR